MRGLILPLVALLVLSACTGQIQGGNVQPIDANLPTVPTVAPYVSPVDPTPAPQDVDVTNLEQVSSSFNLNIIEAQLLDVESRLLSTPDYSRPAVIQGVGDFFGVLWWVFQYSDNLLGFLAPLYTNLLLFAGWALGMAIVYAVTTLVSGVRRIAADTTRLFMRFVQLIQDAIPG